MFLFLLFCVVRSCLLLLCLLFAFRFYLYRSVYLGVALGSVLLLLLNRNISFDFMFCSVLFYSI